MEADVKQSNRLAEISDDIINNMEMEFVIEQISFHWLANSKE
jgi:hypothetical protein